MSSDSGRYWDERALENALFYVDNEVDYSDPDQASFWERGSSILDTMLEKTNHSIAPTAAVLDA
jgi:hypothetical protein